jgi:hypothetical protein
MQSGRRRGTRFTVNLPGCFCLQCMMNFATKKSLWCPVFDLPGIQK